MPIKQKAKGVFNAIITLVLMPLLFVQAVWIRAKLIRLPEASGARNGCHGNANHPQINLLILGDSAAAGVGVSSQSQALSGQLSAQLEQQYQINWQLIATSGYTSAQVLKKVESLSAQSFDFVLLSVGVNDVTHLTALSAWRDNLNTILDTLASKFSSVVVVTPIPPMHLFIGIPQPLRWWIGQRAKRFNSEMRNLVSKQQHRLLLLDSPNIMGREYFAEDGIHPSALTYQIWAEQAAQQIISYSQDNSQLSKVKESKSA